MFSLDVFAINNSTVSCYVCQVLLSFVKLSELFPPSDNSTVLVRCVEKLFAGLFDVVTFST